MEEYASPQFVGIDLHRRRSVIVRMTGEGEVLETVRVSNGIDQLTEVLARAGESPEVVLEATYGWFWAADALAEAGANVHLAHPLGVKAFEYRRVKNDVRDAADLADLLRMGRLPESWIAPPDTRELREMVRHRAKLVALRAGMKCQVHAVLAKCGIHVPMSDLFGAQGIKLLEDLVLPLVFLDKIASQRRVIAVLEAEINQYDHFLADELRTNPAYLAVRTIPGIGPVLGAVFVAEIGDITRFPGPGQLASCAGLTPKHHESDTTVRRGPITKQGSRLVRWAAIESVQRTGKGTQIGAYRDRIAQRRNNRNIAVVAAARRQLGHVFYALRDGHVRALQIPKVVAA